MFDYVQLRRFGIPLNSLPKDSMIANMPASFFRRHPVGSLIGAVLFVILIGINTLLWLNVRRRKAAERQLWDTTLLDGLDPEERWTEDGRCLNPEPPPQVST